MTTKKDVKELLKKKYLSKGDKILDVDIWEDCEFGGVHCWALVKSVWGVIYFYNIDRLGTNDQAIYKGIISLSMVDTRKLKY